MKTAPLFSLFLALALFLSTAPTAYTVEPPLPDLTVSEPVKAQDGPFSVSDALSLSGQFRSTAAAQSTASDWQTECVDCPRQFRNMTDRSLQLDAEGHPHIAYGGDHLYYAWNDGIDWHIETVDNNQWVGEHASLALDGAGRPHISYYDWNNSDLKYAWYDGATWHIEMVDSEGSVGWSTSIEIDELGRPHISYSSNSGLKYARYDGIDWYIEVVDDESGGTTLALDGTGRPHIIYTVRDWGAGYLKYAWYDGEIWQIEIAASQIDSFRGVSLALDSMDRPHISFNTSFRAYNYLDYMWHDEGGWHWMRAASFIGTSSTSLALNEMDQPHISYYDSDGALKYALYDGAEWQIETVDVEGSFDFYSSLVLDAIGQPHISYRVYGGLTYAWHDGQAWQTETVDDAKEVEMKDVSLALDRTDRPHMSYYADISKDLKYAWHNGTSWRIETVDSIGNVGEYNSLALDGVGRPHISYYDGDPNYDLKHAWFDGVEWHIDTVDSEGDVGEYTSLVLDGASQPHISYSDDTNGDLMYAWYDGTSWFIETVDSEGWTGFHSSLVLDGFDRPHISYYDFGKDDLKYAWYDGASWHIETVDSKGSVGKYTSLVLDKEGRPHISYYDYSKRNLKYAWYDGASWHIEAVDSKVYVGECNSLALDKAGQPHISYYQYGEYMLKHAWYNGTIWQAEIIDDVRVWGGTSLALDSLDRPHIGYGGLQYALRTSFLDKRVVSGGHLYPGDTFTYTLTLFNPGTNVYLWDPLPDAIHFAYGSISSTLTPPAVYSPTVHAIAWEGTLPSDTVQTVSFRVTPDITVTKALSSPLPIVNTAWLTDTQNGATITATAFVNLMPLPLSLDKQATPSDDLRNDDTLTYTLTLYGPGLHVRLRDSLPPSVRYVPGSITDTIGSVSGTLVLPAAVYSPTAHAILWEGTLPTDTVEVIRFQVTPGITGTGSLSLSLPIINTAWLTATESGRSVSSRVVVNGWHIYLPLVMRSSQ